MACRKFLRWPDVQHNQVFTTVQPPNQFRSSDGLKTVPCAEVGVSQLAHLGTTLGSDTAQVAPQAEHRWIPELVIDSIAHATSPDEADATEHLQVLTGVRDGSPGLTGQPFDAALTVSEDVDNLKPPAVCQRLRQAGERIK